MKYGIKVLALAGTSSPGQGRPPIGQWIKSADVNAHGGRGFADMTILPMQAKSFDSMEEAWEFWKQESTVQPLRADGRPNRPLTAFTVEVTGIPGT